MEIFNLGQNYSKKRCEYRDSLSKSDANIVSNFQVDIPKNRVGYRDSVPWVTGRRDVWGKRAPPPNGIHIERETGLLARGALTLAANTAGVYMYVAIRNGVVAQQKVD